MAPMFSLFSACALLLASRHAVATGDAQIDTDLAKISRSWGQLSNYADNPPNHFGVKDVGLPDGCQVEQAHLFQRHAQRFPTGGPEDGTNNERFADKLMNYTKAHPGNAGKFTGPLAFLGSYHYIMAEDYLTGKGAQTEFEAGVSFWNRYGRILYNASTDGQLSYDPKYAGNNSARPKPLLRTTSQSRIQNTQINWALGFFGPSFQEVPDPTLSNATKFFDVEIIPEGGNENNSLASYDRCDNSNVESIGYIGDSDVFMYIPKFLQNATARLQQYVPSDFKLTTNDTYAMQTICAYETQYIGMSDFCELFTADEWAGFENSLDIEYFYGYSYGNPTGRSQGISYVLELLARLEHQYITVGNTSLNATLDNNGKTFPLDQLFYADFSHDSIIISILTALSIDYFRDLPSLTQAPPDPHRKFVLSHLTPFAGRLVTELVGCASAAPAAVQDQRTFYYPTQYGYNAANAPHKFIRMRLNNGILPLDTITGGKCKNGRVDGMCEMDKFLESQKNAFEMSDYQYACFGNYTIDNEHHPGKDYNGQPPRK